MTTRNEFATASEHPRRWVTIIGRLVLLAATLGLTYRLELQGPGRTGKGARPEARVTTGGAPSWR